MSEERGLRDICRALNTHIADAELAKSACSALWALSMEGDLLKFLSIILYILLMGV